MKPIVVTAALVGTAAFAQSSPPVVVTGPSSSPNAPVCRTVRDTGSRLTRTRVCMTRAEWASQRRETRQVVDKGQTQMPLQGN